MKLSSICSILLASSCAAFTAPRTSFGVVSSTGKVALNMADDKKAFAFFAKEAPEETPDDVVADVVLSEDEEVELLVEAEMLKTVKAGKLSTKAGVEFAPWMKEGDEKQVRAIMKEKAAARRKRQVEEQSVSGNLYYDSQAQELSGTGLNAKVINGEVELEWATKSERNTKGYLVKRRPAKTEDFSVIASYEDWGPLVSKGTDGGVYRFLDTSASPGGWVYRVSECDEGGRESDLCQCLIEVQTEDEQKAALFAGVGFAVLLIGAVFAGLVLDPYAN